MEPNLTDAELVARAANGSEYAFRTLYRAYARPVYWIAHGLLSSQSDAEDIMQETFVVAWRKLPELELVGESLLPWLATICRFQSANRLRQRIKERNRTAGEADESLPSTVSVEQQVIDAELGDRIAAAVATLGDLDREIFRLCAVEGYAYQAAADELAVSQGVVRNRLSRARTQLRTVLRETEG